MRQINTQLSPSYHQLAKIQKLILESESKTALNWSCPILCNFLGTRLVRYQTLISYTYDTYQYGYIARKLVSMSNFRSRFSRARKGKKLWFDVVLSNTETIPNWLNEWMRPMTAVLFRVVTTKLITGEITSNYTIPLHYWSYICIQPNAKD